MKIPRAAAHPTAVLALLALAVMAALSYRERTIHSDAAYYLFKLVSGDTFVTPHARFIAVLPQIAPLLCTKAGLALPVVMVAFSLSFVGIAVLTYFGCRRWGKSEELALAVPLIALLFATETFYWCISELPLACTVLMLYLALLLRWRRFGWRPAIVLLLGLPTLVFAHPLMIFPFTFAHFFFLLREEKKAARPVLLISLVGMAATFAVKTLAFQDDYEGSALQGPGQMLSRLPEFFNLHSSREFGRYLLTRYGWLSITGVAICAVYIRQRAWWRLMLYGAYIVGYTGLILLTFPSADTGDFYRENLLAPLTVFTVLPLLFDALPPLRRPVFSTILLAAVFLAGLLRVGFHREGYSARLVWLEGLERQYAGQKVILPETPAMRDALRLSWAVPYEVWLISTGVGRNTASIVSAEDPQTLAWATEDPKSFLTRWGAFPYADLPHAYFRLPDTSTTYRIVASPEK